LPRTTVYISSQEGTGGICLLGDVVNVFVAIDTFSRYLSVVPLINKSYHRNQSLLDSNRYFLKVENQSGYELTTVGI
jgi:hypothetical protein